MARQRAQEQSNRSMANPERFSDRAQTVRVSNSRDTRPKGKCAQNKTHLCGTCRKIHDVSERLTNSNYKHDKHPKRALVYDTTTRARQLLGLPHFLAKNLVPRFSAYEMRTDPQGRRAVDPTVDRVTGLLGYMHFIPNRMCELKRKNARHKSRTRNAKCNANSHRHGMR